MKIIKWIDIFYLTFLGITLGSVLSAGTITAPVIFNSQNYLHSQILSRYEEGLLMTAIFLKLNYLLIFTAITVFLREGYDYKRFKRDKIILASSVIVLFGAFMFVFYYTPDIVAYQQAGEEMTKTEIFEKIHKGSEIDFKLLAAGLFSLLFRRLYLMIKSL